MIFIFDYLPDYQHLKTDENKSITIKHLLTMSSGLKFNELNIPYGESDNDFNLMVESRNWVEYTLSQPMAYQPGTTWNYSTGSSIVLGEILRNSTQSSVEDFAETHLFSPMGINDYSWRMLANGLAATGSFFRMLPRDMVKFGFVNLNQGQWNNQQLIPKLWIEESIMPAYAPSNSTLYGYLWWIRDFEINNEIHRSFNGEGWAGQVIRVFPSLELVIVITSKDNGYEVADFSQQFRLTLDYILPAINP